MTVRHLQSLHRSGSRLASTATTLAVAPPCHHHVEPSSSSSSSPSSLPASTLPSSTALLTAAAVVQKFQTGYQECACEVNRFVGRLDGVDNDIKKRLMSHLDSCVAKMNYVAAATASATPALPSMAPSHYSVDYGSVDPAAVAVAATPLMPTTDSMRFLADPASSAHIPPSIPPQPPPPLPPSIGHLRSSAFTAVRGSPSPADTATVDRSPYVYCDEPAVSSTSSWAEDAVAVAVTPIKNPPLDFSMKKTPAAQGLKRPLGDIPVNVPTATNNVAAPSSSRKMADLTTASVRDGSSSNVQRPAVMNEPPAARPCDGPGADPNMWRPW